MGVFDHEELGRVEFRRSGVGSRYPVTDAIASDVTLLTQTVGCLVVERKVMCFDRAVGHPAYGQGQRLRQAGVDHRNDLVGGSHAISYLWRSTSTLEPIRAQRRGSFQPLTSLWATR